MEEISPDFSKIRKIRAEGRTKTRENLGDHESRINR